MDTHARRVIAAMNVHKIMRSLVAIKIYYVSDLQLALSASVWLLDLQIDRK